MVDFGKLGDWWSQSCNGKIRMGLTVDRMVGSILNLRYHLGSKEECHVDGRQCGTKQEERLALDMYV